MRMSKNSFTELSEDFFEFENDLDLLNKKVSGAYFWERVRFSVHMHLRKSVLENDSDGDGGSGNKLSGAWLLLRNLFVRNPFLSQKADLLFYGTGRRKKYEDGLWWDIYQDPIIESIDENSLMIERPYNVSHLTPARTSNLRYVDVVEYTGTLMRKLGVGTVSFSGDEASLIDETEREMALRFGVELPLESIVKKDLSERKVRLPLYRRIIRRVDPNVVLLVNSYNGRETFVEACQSEKVPVVELQHGAISRYHMGYSFPYDKKNVFPDYFFSFGDFWARLVDLPLPDENIHSVGYPYLEKESGKYDEVEKKDQTIFVSQPAVGEELSRFAVELNNQERYQNEIIYKLHPREYDSWKKKYPWLRNSDVRVVDEDEPPLYRLFAESKAQVGAGSTALYEGLNFGLKTYVLDIPKEKHKLEPLIEEGYAELVRSTQELLDHSEIGGDGAVDAKSVFEDNAVEKIAESLRTIREDGG